MRKISILSVCVFALSVLLLSCSKDEPTTVVIDGNASIEGKWIFNKTSSIIAGVSTPEVDYTGNESGCNKDFIVIVAGGVVNSTDYKTACGVVTSSGTWSKTGTTLNVSVPSISFVGAFEIITLTNTELKLKISTTQGGLPLTVTQTFTKG